jgi:hypothetical protein
VNNKQFYSIGSAASTLLIALLSFTSGDWGRRPASMDEPLTLTVQSLKILSPLHLTRSDAVVLRLTVNRSHSFDLTPRLHLNLGEEIQLNSKVVVDPHWVREGNLEFKIELVREGLLKNVLLRCAQVAKSVDDYNRSYQCSMPGKLDNPALTYTLRKGPIEHAPVAKQ